MPICVLFLIWPRDPLYYQISLFLSISGTFEADLRGLFNVHAFKMFKNTFLLKIYPKASKNLNLRPLYNDDHDRSSKICKEKKIKEAYRLKNIL